MNKTAIFLGAGASKAEGAPLQNEIFCEYFKTPALRSNKNMDRELAKFFSIMFNIDVNNDDLISESFPTFEEALGILDLAEQRNESFRAFNRNTAVQGSDRIIKNRQYLVLLMAKCISDSLNRSKGYHEKLVMKLKAAHELENTVFISTNYDILIDNALAKCYPDIALDYGVDFANFDREDGWTRPSGSAVKLLKVHGSLNWQYCQVCNTLTLTPRDKGIIKLITDPNKARCLDCHSIYLPVIIPPTYFKDMSNVFLSVVWNKTEQALRTVENIIFCGYSFPDADIHIKYLLKRIQTNRLGGLPNIFVFNYHNRKKAAAVENEENRYKRFLGNKVQFLTKSFEDFAENPSLYVNQ